MEVSEFKYLDVILNSSLPKLKKLSNAIKTVFV